MKSFSESSLLDTLTLVYAWRCPVRCDHCGFDCGPERKEELAPEVALRYIREAAGNKNLKMIAFSGGEPFLYYENIKAAMQIAGEAGLSSGITTNSYWATNTRIAGSRLQELACAGLREIILSLDDFHAAYIPVSHVKMVAHAALDAGVRVGVNILADKKSRIRGKNAPSLLGLTGEILADKSRFWVQESSPILSGRGATELKDTRDWLCYDISALRRVPCRFVIRDIVITPEQEVFACCGFGSATRNSPSSFTYVGDLKKESLPGLLDKAEGNLLFNLLARCGPGFLLTLAQKKDPSLSVRREFISPCDICHEIGRNSRLRHTISQILVELAVGFSSVRGLEEKG